MYNSFISEVAMNEDLRKFRLHVYLYALIAAMIFGVGGLPFVGIDLRYFYGLLFGVCISFISFGILLFVSGMVLKTGRKFLATMGYFIRLPIYGFTFYMCMRVGVVAGIGCVIGFMAVPAAMIYVYGIKAKLSKGNKFSK